MKKYSWHTYADDWGLKFPMEFRRDFCRRFPSCGGVYFHDEGAILVIGIAHRPPMKGGHTHNHVKNVEKRSKRPKEKV